MVFEEQKHYVPPIAEEWATRVIYNEFWPYMSACPTDDTKFSNCLSCKDGVFYPHIFKTLPNPTFEIPEDAPEFVTTVWPEMKQKLKDLCESSRWASSLSVNITEGYGLICTKPWQGETCNGREFRYEQASGKYYCRRCGEESTHKRQGCIIYVGGRDEKLSYEDMPITVSVFVKFIVVGKDYFDGTFDEDEKFRMYPVSLTLEGDYEFIDGTTRYELKYEFVKEKQTLTSYTTYKSFGCDEKVEREDTWSGSAKLTIKKTSTDPFPPPWFEGYDKEFSLSTSATTLLSLETPTLTKLPGRRGYVGQTGGCGPCQGDCGCQCFIPKIGSRMCEDASYQPIGTLACGGGIQLSLTADHFTAGNGQYAAQAIAIGNELIETAKIVLNSGKGFKYVGKTDPNQACQFTYSFSSGPLSPYLNDPRSENAVLQGMGGSWSILLTAGNNIGGGDFVASWNDFGSWFTFWKILRLNENGVIVGMLTLETDGEIRYVDHNCTPTNAIIGTAGYAHYSAYMWGFNGADSFEIGEQGCYQGMYGDCDNGTYDASAHLTWALTNMNSQPDTIKLTYRGGTIPCDPARRTKEDGSPNDSDLIITALKFAENLGTVTLVKDGTGPGSYSSVMYPLDGMTGWYLSYRAGVGLSDEFGLLCEDCKYCNVNLYASLVLQQLNPQMQTITTYELDEDGIPVAHQRQARCCLNWSIYTLIEGWLESTYDGDIPCGSISKFVPNEWTEGWESRPHLSWYPACEVYDGPPRPIYDCNGVQCNGDYYTGLGPCICTDVLYPIAGINGGLYVD